MLFQESTTTFPFEISGLVDRRKGARSPFHSFVSRFIAVVMMSAQTVNQMEEQELIDMINEKSVYYSKRPAIEDDYKSIISEIRNSWATSFDCMLEEWLLSSKNEETVVYHSNGRDYTVKQVLEEVRKQSKDGKTLQAAMNLYTINALQNSKIE